MVDIDLTATCLPWMRMVQSSVCLIKIVVRDGSVWKWHTPVLFLLFAPNVREMEKVLTATTTDDADDDDET
jgi:hypothetical protein